MSTTDALKKKIKSAETAKNEAQQKLTELRKELKKEEAREKREQERKEREAYEAACKEAGEFVLTSLKPWLSNKTINSDDGYGNKVSRSVWEWFRLDNPEISIPNVLAEGE